ncbi:MAG TPA: hypothetical protein VGM87_22250 [Roseomonas sp.]|jgi:hypothetical protein
MVAEVRSSAHMLTIQPGLYCISVLEPGRALAQSAMLPSTRVSGAPGTGQNGGISTVGLPSDEWLDTPGQAILVRAALANSRLLLTNYLPRGDATATPPKLHIQRLGDIVPAAQAAAEAVVAASPEPTPDQAPPPAIVAHVQRDGDVARGFGEWVGAAGAGRWIEGFSIAAPEGIATQDLEYQAVLGRGWLSPWILSGGFCGSRGMSLPILGLRVRLKGAAHRNYACEAEATFGDGSRIGPLIGAEIACESDALAPLETFRLVLAPKGLDAGEFAAANVSTMPPRAVRKPVRMKT